MHDFVPLANDLRFSVPRGSLEDLDAHRQAAAHDDELISLLRQSD